jgi:hypothetical protein
VDPALGRTEALHTLRNSQESAPVLSPALLKYVALYGGYVVFLHAVDGPWRHWKDGRAGQAIDPWTLQHVLWGALGSYMGLPPTQILVLSSINEMVEARIRKKRPDLLWGTPESAHNVFMDLVATLAGWKLADLLAKRLA